MSLYRGIVHAHSTYSYDGKHSLPEIARAARDASLSFVCMAEHSNTLDAPKVRDFVAECESLSSPEFVMIPGIEFTCDDNLHLLGFGVRAYDPSSDSVYLSGFIGRVGGVSVWAHPMRKKYRFPEGLLTSIDGIEVWNCAYDGSLVPNPRAFDLYLRARSARPGLAAFVGTDLHRLANLRKMIIQLDVPALNEGSILGALRSGSFRAVSRLYAISGRPHGRPAQRVAIRALRAAYSTAQWLRARA